MKPSHFKLHADENFNLKCLYPDFPVFLERSIAVPQCLPRWSVSDLHDAVLCYKFYKKKKKKDERKPAADSMTAARCH